MKKEGKNRTEHGAIIVEATISLSVFMFAMFTLLSVIQMAYAQSRMSIALCCATKELAEYSHVFFITGMNDSFSGTGGKSSELFGELGSFLEDVGGELGSVSGELGDFVTGAGASLGETSITRIIKNALGSGLVYKLMDSNLGDGTAEGAARFKKRYRIESINLAQSRVFESGNEIAIGISYNMRVIKLLNLDYTFHMKTWAYADAWSGKK